MASGQPQELRFGRYRLMEQLGTGGMAVVYRAIVEGPGGFSRSLVIKRMLPELSRSQDFTRMMMHEAKLCGLLHHPGIVQVYEFGDVDGEYYLAMEHVDGYDLSAVLKQCSRAKVAIPVGLCCYLVHEVAGALGYAHGVTDAVGEPLNIVHRDISPSNIMVTKLGQLKLLDFGIAKAATAIRDEVTKTGTLKGKLAYMCPEQAEGRKIDRRADIFALGVVLHEAIVMRRLFRGEDDLQTLRLVRECQVPPPSSVRPECDAEIDAVVLKMLAPKAEDRYASCEEVVAALAPIVHRHQAGAAAMRSFLEQIGPFPKRLPSLPSGHSDSLNNQSLDGSPARNDQSATITSSAGEIHAGTSPVDRRGRSRRRWVVGASVTAGVALSTLLVASRLSGRQQPVERPAAPMAAPALPAPPPGPQRVNMAIKGPPGAKVRIDGEFAGLLPLGLELPSKPEPRAISVDLSGYETWSDRVSGDRDAVIHVSLRRKPKRDSATSVSRPATPAPKKSPIKNPFAP